MVKFFLKINFKFFFAIIFHFISFKNNKDKDSAFDENNEVNNKEKEKDKMNKKKKDNHLLSSNEETKDKIL